VQVALAAVGTVVFGFGGLFLLFALFVAVAADAGPAAVPTVVVRPVEQRWTQTPTSLAPPSQVGAGYLAIEDLPGEDWEPYVRQSAGWAASQGTGWGERVATAPQARIAQVILEVPSGAGSDWAIDRWRALLGVGGRTPDTLPEAGRKYLADVVAAPHTSLFARGLAGVMLTPTGEEIAGVPGRSLTVIMNANRGVMAVDAFEWQSGRFATLLVMMRQPDAPPIDTQELLRRARARLDAAQKAN